MKSLLCSLFLLVELVCILWLVVDVIYEEKAEVELLQNSMRKAVEDASR